MEAPAGVPRSRKTSVHSLLRSLRPQSGKREIQTTSTEVSDDKKTSVHSLLRSLTLTSSRFVFQKHISGTYTLYIHIHIYIRPFARHPSQLTVHRRFGDKLGRLKSGLSSCM